MIDMSNFALGLIISVIVYLAVGYYAGRKVSRLEDFYVAGRNAPTLLIVGTLVASFLSTNAFMGEVGMAYMGFGPLIILSTGVNLFGYILGALFFGRYLRRSEAITVPQFFGQRFNSRRLQVVAGITVMIGLSAYLLAVTLGATILVTAVTDFSYTTAVILVWLGYTLFTLYAGSKGVILTDTMMFILFTSVALAAMLYIIDAAGGVELAVESLARFPSKPDIISWHGNVGPQSSWKTPAEALMWVMIIGIAWGIVVAVSPWQASRYLMAKSEHTVIRSAFGACLGMYVLYPMTMFSAAIMNLLNPAIDPAESVMIWAAMNILPLFAGVVLVCGIMAAGLSSASTFLSLVGFSVANDILRPKNTQQQVMITRYAILVTGLCVLVTALLVDGKIFWITYFAGPVFASSWGLVAFMAIWSQRITEAGAFWGMIAGFLGNIGANLLMLIGGISLPVYLDPILIGAVFSLAVILVVSKAGTVSQQEQQFRQQLHIAPDTEFDSEELTTTLRWPKILVGIGLSASAIMLYFWALPLSEARGYELGEINGEIVFALVYGGLLVLTGLVGRYGIKKLYAKPPPTERAKY